MRRVDDDIGAASWRRAHAAPAEKSLATTVRTPWALSRQIMASPIGPQPMTIATSRLPISLRRTACQPIAIGSVSALALRREPVRHRHHQRLLDEHVLGVGAGGRGREPDGVRLAGATDHRQGHHVPSGGDALTATRAVFRDLAAELVAEDDALIGAHEVPIADFAQHIGQLIAVLSSVEVRSADPATQHPQRDLSPPRAFGGQLRHLQLGLSTNDRLHVPSRSCSRWLPSAPSVRYVTAPLLTVTAIFTNDHAIQAAARLGAPPPDTSNCSM